MMYSSAAARFHSVTCYVGVNADAGTKAVKTATVQTEVIDGFQILRSKDCTFTMQSLAAWTKALKRKYDHLTVSCNALTCCR